MFRKIDCHSRTFLRPGPVFNVKFGVVREKHQGRSQKWPNEGVLRPHIAKGGCFEGVEVRRIRARTSFFKSFGKNYQNIWVKGGFRPPSPPLDTPLFSGH